MFHTLFHSYVFYKVLAQSMTSFNFTNSHVHEAEIVEEVLLRFFFSWMLLLVSYLKAHH